MGAMVTLEGSQPFDLLLQHATFATELLMQLGPPLLGLGDKRFGPGDECVVLGFAGGHELVVLGLTGREKLFPMRGIVLGCGLWALDLRSGGFAMVVQPLGPTRCPT